MHEYPLTEQIVRIAVEHAEKNRAARITRISLVVGDMSGFVADSIQMYFDVIARGTTAEGAILEIEHIRPKMKCGPCGLYFERKPYSFACPRCGNNGVPTEIGKECYVKDIEIEIDNDLKENPDNNGDEKD